MTLFSSPKISLCIARLNKVIRGGPVSQRLCGFLLYEERNTISVAVFGAHAKWQTDTRACVSLTSVGKRPFVVSERALPYSDHFTPRRTQPAAVKSPPAHGRPPPDRPSASRGLPSPASILERLFVYGEQCSVDGRINLGGIRRTERLTDGRTGRHCCGGEGAAATLLQ